MEKEEILNLIRVAFDNHISTSVGNYFGSPSSHLEGKDEFFVELKEKLNNLYTEEDLREAFQAGRLKGSRPEYNQGELDENEWIEQYTKK